MGKHFQHVKLEYTTEDLQLIEMRVEEVQRLHPEFSDRKARIWEVISRYQGEAGLSESKVDRLTAYMDYLFMGCEPKPYA